MSEQESYRSALGRFVELRGGDEPLPRCREMTIDEAPQRRCRRRASVIASIPGLSEIPVCVSCATYYAVIRSMSDEDRSAWITRERERDS